MPRGAKRALDARIKIAQPTSRDQQFTHHDVHANCANQIATTNAYTDKCHRPSCYDVRILGPFAHYVYAATCADRRGKLAYHQRAWTKRQTDRQTSTRTCSIMTALRWREPKGAAQRRCQTDRSPNGTSNANMQRRQATYNAKCHHDKHIIRISMKTCNRTTMPSFMFAIGTFVRCHGLRKRELYGELPITNRQIEAIVHKQTNEIIHLLDLSNWCLRLLAGVQRT